MFRPLDYTIFRITNSKVVGLRVPASQTISIHIYYADNAICVSTQL